MKIAIISQNFQVITQMLPLSIKQNFHLKSQKINLETRIAALSTSRNLSDERRKKEKMLEVKCLFGHFIPFFVNLIIRFYFYSLMYMIYSAFMSLSLSLSVPASMNVHCAFVQLVKKKQRQRQRVKSRR